MLPAGGYLYNTNQDQVNTVGKYWSTTIRSLTQTQALNLTFYLTNILMDEATNTRYNGFLIRGIQ